MPFYSRFRLKGIVLLSILVWGQLAIAEYSSDFVPTEPELRTEFEHLTPQQQDDFLANRKSFLNALEKGLRYAHWSYGVGFVVGDTVRFIKGKGNDEAHPKFTERAFGVDKTILSAIDRHLWSQPLVVGNANEFGFIGSLGLQGLGGVGEKGWGRIFDLGISVGYNKERKSLVFELFRGNESYKSSLMKTVFTLGAAFKLGFHASYAGDGVLRSHGSSHYPPAFPTFSASTDRSLIAGINSGVPGLFFPPSPIGDMLTYQTNLNRFVVVRFEASRLFPGFLRIQTDFGFIGFFESVLGNLRNLQSLWGPRSCEGIFL